PADCVQPDRPYCGRTGGGAQNQAGPAACPALFCSAACRLQKDREIAALHTACPAGGGCPLQPRPPAVCHAGPVEANVLREHLALLERRAGVPGLTFSAIRETAICQALE